MKKSCARLVVTI